MTDLISEFVLVFEQEPLSFSRAVILYSSLALLTILFCALFTVYLHKRINEDRKRSKKLAVTVGAIAVCTLIMLGVSATQQFLAIDVCNEYYEGNYLTAEGEVSGFEPYSKGNKVYDRLIVEGIEFKYPPLVYGAGYIFLAKDGGYITQNGQHVKIRYVIDAYGAPHIMYLEILSSDLPLSTDSDFS